MFSSESIMIKKNQFEEAAYILKAISNEMRISILVRLCCVSERSVSDLMKELDCEQSLLSHHLTDMRAKGILSCRRSGRFCFYSIKNQKVRDLLECMFRENLKTENR